MFAHEQAKASVNEKEWWRSNYCPHGMSPLVYGARCESRGVGSIPTRVELKSRIVFPAFMEFDTNCILLRCKTRVEFHLKILLSEFLAECC